MYLVISQPVQVQPQKTTIAHRKKSMHKVGTPKKHTHLHYICIFRSFFEFDFIVNLIPPLKAPISAY